ncbi:MAG: GNAT family N-acetyltransferase [Cytophagaceae bacterium]
MVTFKHKEESNTGQFEILEQDQVVGMIIYRWAGSSTIIIEHTETKKEFTGKGYAKQLVYKVVELAKENDAKIIPLCSFAKKVMEADQSLAGLLKHSF